MAVTEWESFADTRFRWWTIGDVKILEWADGNCHLIERKRSEPIQGILAAQARALEMVGN